MAHLRTKNGDQAILKMKPKLNKAKLLDMMPHNLPTEASERYKKRFKKRVVPWRRRNALAYSVLVKECTYSPSATTVILDNPKASARLLFYKLKERFDQGDMTGIIESKLATFNSMVLANSETADNFINRLLLAKINLHSLGCSHIN